MQLQSLTRKPLIRPHSIDITSALTRHPTTAPGCGGADFGGRRPSGAARQRRQLHGFGGIGSGGGGIGSGSRIGGGCGGFAAAAEISGGDTAAALAVSAELQPLQRCAAVRIWRRELSLLCACRCSATAFSSPPLGHQVAWSKHLCELQKKLVRNCKEQEVEHVGQLQAFRNREKGRAARVAFERRLRLLHARSHCSAMNMAMLQIGSKSACGKINACCCARWRA